MNSTEYFAKVKSNLLETHSAIQIDFLKEHGDKWENYEVERDV